jgi:N-acetyl-alpha-D-glucosaminyl L-malate synthase BshA
LKICMLTTSFPRFKGDPAGIFIYNLCKQLIKKGIDIDVIAPHDHGCEFLENWDGLRIHRVPYFFPFKYQRLCYGAGILQNVKKSVPAMIQLPFLVIAEILYSIRIIKRYKADLIHAHWSLPQGLAGVLCGYISDVPCITTIHGSDVYGLKYPFINALNAKVMKDSNACTANSRRTARACREISGREDIEIIPMGIDPGFFSKSRDVEFLRKKAEIEGETILFVGRLIDWKGVDDLIRAVPKVLEKYPKAKLLLVGSGPRKRRLINLAKTLDITNNVLFTGEVNQGELPRYYSVANVFVLPSIVNDKGETEGLGVVLLEAMACGIPVIGSNVGGIPDIINDGETGLLANQKDPDDLGQKIIMLLTDENLRKRVIENGLKFVKENFTWEVIADRFIKLYQDGILENTRGRINVRKVR